MKASQQHCSQCDTMKSFYLFSPDARRPRGFATQCRECIAANVERRRAVKRDAKSGKKRRDHNPTAKEMLRMDAVADAQALLDVATIEAITACCRPVWAS